jgi:hypothetical protein
MTDAPVTINLHDGYGKVRYRRLISNDYCNEEFEIEIPVPVDRIYETLMDLEVQGVAFSKRALARHEQYTKDKRSILYGMPDEEE